MGSKLGKAELPSGHTKDDFECFGPPAMKDGEFKGTKIADLGCFTQDGKDSNKYYNACVCQSKKTKAWFTYYEWGRTGSSSPDFQFTVCDSEADAQDEYESQLHSKNDKRGEWTTIAGIKTLRAKAGKDCYLVRPLSTRSTGLPSAKTIKINDGKAPAKTPVLAAGAVAPVRAKGPEVDPQTQSLLSDLKVATVKYTKGAMADSSIPTQGSIDEGRQILTEAQKRLIAVGDDIDAQVNDKKLNDFSKLLYSRIPKIKPVGAAASTWVLSKDNIMSWKMDLDAFESASFSVETHEDVSNPLSELNVEMNWLNPKSPIGSWITHWAANATRNRHYGVGNMKIHNAWSVRKQNEERNFLSKQDDIFKNIKTIPSETALHQVDRIDVSRQKEYKQSNTVMLFHGTRSVNVSGILRKALMLPKKLTGVQLSGSMYGDGIYGADDWKKSAGYTSLGGSIWSGGSGGVSGRHAFMFIMDVVLGKPHIAKGAYGYDGPPSGHHSVFAKASQSGVANNEFIVYESAQHNLRYLLEFST